MKEKDLPAPLSSMEIKWLYETADEVSYQGVQPLYHMGYYDGPLTGIAFHRGRGKFFYVKCHDPDNRGLWYGWMLSPEEFHEINWFHNLFCRYVGTHTNYRWDVDQDRWVRDLGKLRPHEEWKNYYDLAKNRDSDELYRMIEKRDIDVLLDNPF